MRKLHVSITYARIHLSQLVRRVEKGQIFVITRRGVPVAEIVPYKSADKKAAPQGGSSKNA
jgi:prevent-host-death family protein